MASVSLIIVNYNAGKRLKRCLAAVKAQTLQPLEVLVVDNGSNDGSQKAALKAFPDVIGLPMGENLGFAAGNNRAVESAKGDWLALLNPDAFPEPDWLEQLMAATKRWPGAKAFGSTQLSDTEPGAIDGAGDNLHILGIPYRGHFGWSVETLPPEGPVFAPCAAAALYRSAIFRQLGGFDERFFCYCEDVDLGFRLRLAGHDSIQVRSAVVRHEGSAIAGLHSSFQIYHGHRNRHMMLAKNLPGLLFWPLLPLHLMVSLFFAVRLLGSCTARAYFAGIWDAVARIGTLRKERRQGAQAQLSAKALLLSLVWSPNALRKRRGKVLLTAKRVPI